MSQYGDNLIVGCSTDKFNQLKGKKSIFPYKERSEILLSCKYVSKVIPEESWDQKIDDVKKYNIDFFIMGDDWAGKFDFLQDYTNVVYLPRTSGISTTQIKDVIQSVAADRKQRLVTALEGLNALVEEL